MKTAAKHAPGPWVAKKEIPQTGNIAIVSKDGWEVAFATNRAWGYGSVKSLSNAQTAANAALIAAAPDLLKALQVLKDAGYLEGIYTPTAELVDSAITKATKGA